MNWMIDDSILFILVGEFFQKQITLKHISLPPF
jgi:hypothetical protein